MSRDVEIHPMEAKCEDLEKRLSLMEKRYNHEIETLKFRYRDLASIENQFEHQAGCIKAIFNIIENIKKYGHKYERFIAWEKIKEKLNFTGIMKAYVECLELVDRDAGCYYFQVPLRYNSLNTPQRVNLFEDSVRKLGIASGEDWCASVSVETQDSENAPVLNECEVKSAEN